jgi:hypothetical protein
MMIMRKCGLLNLHFYFQLTLKQLKLLRNQAVCTLIKRQNAERQLPFQRVGLIVCKSGQITPTH